MPLTKKSQIEALRKMRVGLSEETVRKLEASDDIVQTSRNLILDAFDSVREYVDGVHIMPLGRNSLAKQILESI